MKKINIHKYPWSFKEGGFYKGLMIQRNKDYVTTKTNVLIMYEKY